MYIQPWPLPESQDHRSDNLLIISLECLLSIFLKQQPSSPSRACLFESFLNWFTCEVWKPRSYLWILCLPCNKSTAQLVNLYTSKYFLTPFISAASPLPSWHVIINSHHNKCNSLPTSQLASLPALPNCTFHGAGRQSLWKINQAMSVLCSKASKVEASHKTQLLTTS